ncbi:hypothetical protein TCAL_14958 [Tigriopus californicus]|uniref:C2H2-type domain-containing protein n=1 Tax=Tigriopus californicus TaxID=6832 RepID=A0A553N8M4_TIGCA|nr:uncharacterized protein LOC131884794 [Tigriopus californicus]XP_059088662.1 uncharacterized protein LOC131884794 [Tigriopus californicus]TRY61788.1 hypothetical protein TCAL_14958 [Tigriopus californicus]
MSLDLTVKGRPSVNSPVISPSSVESNRDDNYLKAYPYLFVRDSNQSDYFCTLCDNYVPESELHSHLFESHKAEDIEGSFVRICSEEANRGYFIQRQFLNVCIICWAKIPKLQHTDKHRVECKPPLSRNEESPPYDSIKIESTPDISSLLNHNQTDMNGHGLNGNSMGGGSPYHHSNLVIDIPEESNPSGNEGSMPIKRGRKKANPPHHIMPSAQFSPHCVQCSLCSMMVPTPGFVVHLRDFHKITCQLVDTTCPLCLGMVPVLDLANHLANAHGLVPQAAVNSILLWVLSSSTLSLNEFAKPHLGPNRFGPPIPHPHHNHNPVIELDLQKTMGIGMPPLMKRPPASMPGGSEILSNSVPHRNEKAQIPTVLQVLLNKSDDQPRMAVETIVSKFISVQVGANNKESIQCQVCSKWFGIPPVKHLKAHLLNFKEDKKCIVSLINGLHVCIICYDTFDTISSANDHLSKKHDLGFDFDDKRSVDHYPSKDPNESNEPKEKPKKVELDNAGRVKSGKVRKQCELCGEWSNIKWFFKHMSEVHQALFCRCCREYLPIHEHEEHKKWHAEPPYMGQKIRIEQGQPVVIDRKERASLTPIGSLAAWGGSSGGKVVKAVDLGPSKATTKKRKASSVSKIQSNANQLIGHVDYTGGPPAKLMNNNSTKDTLMPKETCPVCGIQITYKNLARHIKLRHKIKYKFCHKCRKLVPNTTYDDHKLACERNEVGTDPDLVDDPSGEEDTKDDIIDPTEFLDTTTDIDQDDIAAEDSPTGDGRKPDDFRANTSKTKLESLLGKEFKHPRRRCAICGYTVSYSNFKRHLRNAHPSQYEDCEKDPNEFKKALASLCEVVAGEDGSFVGHIMDEDDEEEEMDSLDGNDKSVDGLSDGETDPQETICPVCEVEIPISDMEDHCLSKHKEAYQWCADCKKYVVKKTFAAHLKNHDESEEDRSSSRQSEEIGQEVENEEDDDDASSSTMANASDKD